LGVISNQISPETRSLFEKAFVCLKHRGPHGNRVIEQAFPGSATSNFIFGHHRLAIVDLNERANQPLYSNSGSILIMNGEIYNAVELREELKNKFEFSTTSDSEVALAVLEIFGISGISKLDGMFAFAFYPSGSSSVWLGRDRLGIKPLYLTRHNDEVWFSSEAKPLARALRKGLDEIGISEWVQYQFQISNRTFFNEIYSVPPGHLLTIKDGIIKSRQYWNIEDHLSSNNGKPTSTEDAISDLRHLLEKSVQRHLMADVEVATITSGGMDSSTVSALASKMGVRSAFVGRYLESSFDETNFAQSVANFSDLSLKIIDISENDFLNTLKDVALALDYPSAGPGSVGQYLVAKEIARTHRVVLAGTGGDELFLGYTRDRFPLWSAQKAKASDKYPEAQMPPNSEGYEALFYRFIQGGGWKSPISGFMSTLERTSNEESLLSIDKHRRIAIASELRAFISPSGGESLTEIHDSLLRYEVLKFLPSLLQVEDRMTMAHGLESRVPLLDLELIEFLLALPASVRMTGTHPKDLLRMAMAKELPQTILNRKDKMGFPVPIAAWSKSGLPSQMRLILESLKSREIPGIDVNVNHEIGGGSHLEARELWGGLILETWLQTLD
jgi:asparagine synthase (glutamine-hydrolysing)